MEARRQGEETITFLGSGGGRIVVANQLLGSGGLWLKLNGTEVLLDPGPGSIVQSTKRKLRAEKLSAIILSHRHLDHSADVNIMVEAITQGGFRPHGWLFAPSDAFDGEPVLYSYLKKYLDGIEVLKEGESCYVMESGTTTTYNQKVKLATGTCATPLLLIWDVDTDNHTAFVSINPGKYDYS